MTTTALKTTVTDFAGWKSVFDSTVNLRRRHGATGHRVLSNGNDVLVLVDFPDEASARALASDPEIREGMKRSGIQGAPDLHVWASSEEVQY
jgi:hypothetical protein